MRLRKQIAALVLFVFTFLLYANTILHEYAVDDFLVYTGNTLVGQGAGGVGKIATTGFFYGCFDGNNSCQYRPLGLAVFAVQKQLFGYNAHLNHYVNVILYSLTCVLLFLFLCRLLQPRGVGIALVASLLFAAHPVHTEVVANIKSLEEILCFLFSMGAIFALVKYIDNDSPIMLVVAVCSYFLALLCKESGVTMLAVVPLALFFFRGARVQKIALMTAIFLGVTLIFLCLRATILDVGTFGKNLEVFDNTLMAAPDLSHLVATAFVILGKYAKLLFVPFPLCWDYSYNQIPIVGWTSRKAVCSLLLYAGLAVYGVARLKSRDVFAFCALFFLITMSVASNLVVKSACTLGERLLFTPSLAFCLALGVGMQRVAQKGPMLKRMIWVLGCLLLITYSALTVRRNLDWHDDLTLYSRDLPKSPNSARAHQGLAVACLIEADTTVDTSQQDLLRNRGISELKIANNICPISDDYLYLGYALAKENRLDEALVAYNHALHLHPVDMMARRIINSIAIIRTQKQEYFKAEQAFEDLLTTDRSHWEIFGNLGFVYQLAGNTRKALLNYQKALDLNPANANLHANLAMLHESMGDTAQARVHRAIAVSLLPRPRWSGLPRPDIANGFRHPRAIVYTP